MNGSARTSLRSAGPSLAVQRCELLLCASNQCGHLSRSLFQQASRRSQHDASAGAVQQTHSQLLLQRFDLLSHSRLAQVHFFAGSPKAQVLSERAKDPKPEVFHCSTSRGCVHGTQGVRDCRVIAVTR